MALSAATTWEIRTTGNAANAGGFVTGASGTDRSQQDAAHVVIDGATITATVNATTTILDLVGYTAIADDVGNLVRIAGGDMTAGTYQITAINAGGGNRWTIDRSGGTAGQTGTGRMGGAQSDPALVAALLVAGNTVHQKAGTYSITSASTNVAGGCVSIGVATVQWNGYQTTRDDLGTAPLLQASGISTATLFTYAAGDASIVNVSFDGASLTSIRGFATSSRGAVRQCTALNCTNSGFALSSSQITVSLCRASGCGTTGAGFLTTAGSGLLYGCVASDNTVPGFSIGNTVYFLVHCIADTNTGASSDGFLLSSGGSAVMNCSAYANGRDGFRLSGSSTRAFNCLSEANGAFGFINTGVTAVGLLYCGAFNNTSGATSGTFIFDVNFVTGTGSFFTDAAAGDFSLNNTAGAGADARAAGILGVFPGGLTTGYLDIGAAQHADPAGGGSAFPVIGPGGLVL